MATIRISGLKELRKRLKSIPRKAQKNFGRLSAKAIAKKIDKLIGLGISTVRCE